MDRQFSNMHLTTNLLVDNSIFRLVKGFIGLNKKIFTT